MSEIINNSRLRINAFKDVVLQIHEGRNIENAKKELAELMKVLPHGEVITAEQELINEGIPEKEIIQFCDVHSSAIKGLLKEDNVFNFPEGHPVHTFISENKHLKRRIELLENLIGFSETKEGLDDASDEILKIKQLLNELMDVDKHYLRKENLIFPFLEKNNITGPSVVMWAKDDEVRSYIKNAIASLRKIDNVNHNELIKLFNQFVKPTADAINEMIYKEENILLPMTIDLLTETDWHQIYTQSSDYGYALFAPENEWLPEGEEIVTSGISNDKIKLSTGSFSVDELESLFKTLPFDLTFVDKDDRVKFFSEGPNRVFARSKAIIGRLVQHCHPPSSVGIVEKILADFKNGNESTAKFWINMHGKFVHIAYYALRDKNKNYMGTLEVTQDATELRSLEGERRILNYDRNNEEEKMQTKPEWVLHNKIAYEYDAQADLMKGIHPLNLVTTKMEELNHSEIFILKTGFLPQPLIDKMRELGYTLYTEKDENSIFITYIQK